MGCNAQKGIGAGRALGEKYPWCVLHPQWSSGKSMLPWGRSRSCDLVQVLWLVQRREGGRVGEGSEASENVHLASVKL